MFGLAVLGGGLFPCPDSREERGGMLLDLSFDSCVLSSASAVRMGSFVTPCRSGGFLCCVLCSSTTGRVYLFDSMEGQVLLMLLHMRLAGLSRVPCSTPRRAGYS